MTPLGWSLTGKVDIQNLDQLALREDCTAEPSTQYTVDYCRKYKYTVFVLKERQRYDECHDND